MNERTKVPMYELEQTRLQLDILDETETSRSLVRTYADAARMTSASMPTQSSSAVRPAAPESVFYTVDTSKVSEVHIGNATQTMIRKIVEQEMRKSMTRDGRNANRLRIIGRNEEEMQKIKTILDIWKAPGARVLRDQLYPTKVDSMNRTAVFDQEFNVLLNQENEV
ncbi:hypothetical protein FOVG_19341 [Fusarium oxysporum f. sp. pisi HDV247]|uniref:Uncharacterized protein n=1 Tax=Fusarium oxysporum f. sp. pisi HDV247 TaxID=1080344 RepID=W9NMM1_FUSOX|nr:hypothetical protein FOVG_19341 [Fusarium oxysporum f. sp. pisi HDV247]